MSIKYLINFVSTRGLSSKSWTKEMEFNDKNHFDNYINKMSKDQSKIKIIGFEKITSESKEYSESDMKELYTYTFLMFKKAKSTSDFESFEKVMENLKNKKNGL